MMMMMMMTYSRQNTCMYKHVPRTSTSAMFATLSRDVVFVHLEAEYAKLIFLLRAADDITYNDSVNFHIYLFTYISWKYNFNLLHSVLMVTNFASFYQARISPYYVNKKKT